MGRRWRRGYSERVRGIRDRENETAGRAAALRARAPSRRRRPPRASPPQEQAANRADNSRATKGGQMTCFRQEADAGVAAVAVSRYVDRPDRKEKLMSDEDLK